MPWISTSPDSSPEDIAAAVASASEATGIVPFHKLSRQQLLTLAISLQDQRDRALANQPRTIGYVVVDRKTKNIDWDGELHPLRVDAVESLTGSRQPWSKSVEEETEDRPYWGKVYMICPVVESRTPGDAQ